MIIPYSAIKISAKVPAPYSVLNPDTNSDSPSAKSKGVRFVSATAEINRRIIKGAIKIKLINFFSVAPLKENLLLKINIENRSNAKLISYEMVWAILRIAPKYAYWEKDLHPSRKIGKIPSLIITKIIIPKNIKFIWSPEGVDLRRINVIVILREGLIKNIILLLFFTSTISFINSLTASAMGCKIPIILTLFGPLRNCAYLRIFRSNKVINATLINNGIIIINCEIVPHIIFRNNTSFISSK